MVEDMVRKGRLLDLYGALLTDKQRRCMEMYYLMDLSLAEIGEELAISRQGAYDMLHRAAKILETYETKLHLLSRHELLHEQLDEVAQLIARKDEESLQKATHILTDID